MFRRFLGELLDQWLQGRICHLVGHARLQPNADVKRLDRILRNFQRQVDVAIAPGKARASHAHDGVVLADQLQVLAENTQGSPLKCRCQNL